MKTVTLQYFALLREKAACAEEIRETDAKTLEELYREVRKVHGFPLEVDRVRVAVGDEYVPMETRLDEGMRVTFIPPVAGG
jgi:molybdopterin converting factor small subunit